MQATTATVPTATSTAAIARNEATTLGIGFAFLLLFVQGKQSLPLAEYMGEAQASILDRASKFVLSPKPIDDNSPGLDKDTRIRIGNLTFSRPPVEVWTSATSVAESLSEIISHITLEQRLSYIKQQDRSRALIAVQKWGVRRAFATSTLNVAKIIKRTTMTESKVLAEANTWRRSMYEKLDRTLKQKIEKSVSFAARRFQKNLQPSIRQKEAPITTPAAKIKGTPGNEISFLPTAPNLDDMAINEDGDSDDEGDDAMELEGINKAEEVRKKKKRKE